MFEDLRVSFLEIDRALLLLIYHCLFHGDGGYWWCSGFQKSSRSRLCVVTDIDLKFVRAGLVLRLVLVVLSPDH